MDQTTVVVTPVPLESEPLSSQLSEESPSATETEIEEVIEDTETVADEILVEVKECQSKLNQATEGLERLQSDGATREQMQEALQEVRNLREEMRNLLAEVKELLPQRSPNQLEGSPQSIPSLSPPTVEITEINPVEVAAVQREANPPKKKKRYRI